MTSFIAKHKFHWTCKDFLKSVTSGTLLFFLSLVVNYAAGVYATARMSNSVNDIVLSNIRVFDVDGIFVYGVFLFILFVACLLIYEPKNIPFVVKSLALFILIRSFFIMMTHLGPYPTHVSINSDVLSKFSPGGDFFFSGHTGIPFLMALIYWENKSLRYIFIAIAILFGVVALMGHLHYTIDVLSAFFITYTIYRLAEIFFPKDKKMFM